MLTDRDEEGSTPLLLGVGSGRREVVQQLIEHGADVNTANKDLVRCKEHFGPRETFQFQGIH